MEEYDLTELVGDYQFNQNKNMNILRKIWSWIIWSSVNEDKISLTLKAGIPFLVLWGVSDTSTLTELIGTIGKDITLLAQLIAGVIALFGLVRKIMYTYR